MYLIFDTETTNLPNDKIPLDAPNQARICQLACLLLDKEFKEISSFCTLIKPTNWIMSPGAESVHKITQKACEDFGIPINEALTKFDGMISDSEFQIAHNIKFDRKLIDTEYILNKGAQNVWDEEHAICTMLNTTMLCKIPNKWRNGFKWPKLIEVYQYLFNESISGAHDAMVDVRATARVFKYLVENHLIQLPIIAEQENTNQEQKKEQLV